MLKKILFMSVISLSNLCIAAEPMELYQQPLSSLKNFPIQSAQRRGLTADSPDNALQTVNVTKQGNTTITRFQQYYQGIPVVGAQVTAVKNTNKTLVNGYLLEDINLNVIPKLSPGQALESAKKAYFGSDISGPVASESAVLQIRPGLLNKLSLVYLISFKTQSSDNQPKWPFFILNANTGQIIKQWDNINHYEDMGPGGNEKVKKYWYGREGLPALIVKRTNNICSMETEKVKLVNLNLAWDWMNIWLTPHQYPCGRNLGDPINGAYSPINDAYFFAHMVVNMYQQWYGVNVLQDAKGKARQLIMRAHFGEEFDNAFWDGETISFGDGSTLFPLTSLDIVGHEATHGFTEQHSNLEYHDESGAINEALSDMAAQASRAFLLEKSPQLYNRVHLKPNEITWGIGETVVRDSFGKALRFMDNPSEDGESADCFDKEIAQNAGATCVISYNDLLETAQTNYNDEDDKQSFIVHSASGIFNKAFYLLTKEIGIKRAYHVMVLANISYLTPDSNFSRAACGVIYAAKDLQLDTAVVKNIFGQVGIDTTSCAI